MSWEQLAPQTVQRLSNDLSISPQVAAGIVGQLGYESAGLQSINEMQPVVPGSRGGFGWAQWTGPRRKQFESWAQQNNMDVADPEANYQFLVHELTQTPEKKVLSKLQGIEDPVEAGKVFTDSYLRPGVPAYDKRASWVEKTLNTLIPAAQAQTTQGGNVAEQGTAFSLEQLQNGLQKAQAAGNQEAVLEIQQLIEAQQPTTTAPQTAPEFSIEQLQQGLQRAQAAGNQEAVLEIQGLIEKTSTPPQAQAPQQPSPPQDTSFFRVPTAEEAQRTGELTLRNIGEGVEQAFTFPVRAIGEAGASIAGLAGFPKASQAISETVGMRTPTVAGGIANVAGLATPQTPFEKTVGGGVKALAGAGLGGVASNLARNAPQMTQQAVSNILPTAATGKQLGLFGGVGSAMEAAPMETAAGMAGVTTLAALAAGAAGRKARLNVNTKKAENAILESAGGSPSRASMDSEIIKKINTEVKSPVRLVDGKAQPLTAMELNNKVQKSFTNDTLQAVKKLPNDYPNKSLYVQSLGKGIGLDSTTINSLRTDPVGIAVADAIEQAQRARVLTEAIPAAGGISGAAARAGVDAAPIGLSAATGIPAYIPQGLTASLKNRLGGKVSRADQGSKFISEPMVKAADNILAKTGPSERALGIKTIEEIAEQASKLQAAKQKSIDSYRSASKEASETAQKVALENWDKGVTGKGGIQGTMTDYTGLKDRELIDALQEVSIRQPLFAPYIQAIKESGKIPSATLLGQIQDDVVRVGLEKGYNVEAGLIKQAAIESGIKGAASVPNELYKRASNLVSSLDDEALQLVVNRTTSASGKEIDKPRAYATSLIAKILNDRAQGRTLDDAAQSLLDTLGL